ncbi:hypothetical protein [Paenibacillus sinopodophylli]|uniref:hypothetical protein n=1 Tax=Paenibacillus sinopodophylli TaxID=1837342 RepID=UPI00110CCE9D|nr:hypothetical protein [Paenibacillus sinopodophylli]
MNFKILFYVTAFGLGLIVPFVTLILKVFMVGIVFFMDAKRSDDPGKKKNIYVVFVIGVVLSYLYKLATT